ncbi:NHL repeat containing protein [Oopsacas minuta]|uniref:NHL repeat containing protein n=1 Tax=Oopsacas minuta TaxID=111878 RepID=A0AAV7JQQ6_9METZ|nr:NHL repeat containing protein [Oopsacas minuta]
MAERFPEIKAPIIMNQTEVRINQLFDQLVLSLNRRRIELIREFREKRGERKATTSGREQTIRQLQESKANLQSQMKENLLHSMRERMIEEMDDKMRELQATVRETEVLFQYDAQQIEKSISVLGQLIERDIIQTPNYSALHQPSISVGKKGTDGEITEAGGVVFDENTQLIYLLHGSIPCSISVFAVTGEYIKTVYSQRFMYPRGIAMSGEDVYVSDIVSDSIYHFKLPDFYLVTKVGKKGNDVGEFNHPCGLAVSTDGSVFVADYANHRIAVMNPKLKHQHYITHHTMTNPRDVKLLDGSLYVLSITDNPCLHVFSPAGEKLRSFITCSKQGNAQVKGPFTFCFDKKQNILIGDDVDRNIKVFSLDGDLLHILGDTQDDDKRIVPTGIVVTNSNKIICSSYNTNFGLHIFSQ